MGSSGVTAVAVALALLAGCAPQRVVPFAAAGGDPPLSVVEMDVVADAAKPACVMVLPLKAGPSTDAATLHYAEAALVRYLRDRVPRVIPPSETASLVKSSHIDISDDAARAKLADTVQCPVYVGGTVEVTRVFVVVANWTLVTLQIEADDAAKTEVVWRARNTASRGAGGLPFSPLAAAFMGVSATQAATSPETTQSLADDALRRIFALACPW